MIVTRITCAEFSAVDHIICPYVDIEDPDVTKPLARQITGALTVAGWSEDADGYHCPRHNPAMVGQTFHLEDEFGYLHLGNGVYARRHESNYGPQARIEVRVGKPPAAKEN